MFNMLSFLLDIFALNPRQNRKKKKKIKLALESQCEMKLQSNIKAIINMWIKTTAILLLIQRGSNYSEIAKLNNKNAR